MASDGAPGVRVAVPRARLEALCAGHFPGDPIVPGAYVAGLLAEVSARVLALDATPAVLAEVERCTFLAPLRPVDDAVLVAAPPEHTAAGFAVSAEVQVGGRCVARGRFRFA